MRLIFLVCLTFFSCLRTEEIILLNVGGVVFSTLNSTLCKYPRCTLCNLRIYTKDSEPHVFIDRDPQIFASVLRFLRTGQITIPSDSVEYRILINELKYYNLTEAIPFSHFDDSNILSRKNALVLLEYTLPFIQNKIWTKYDLKTNGSYNQETASLFFTQRSFPVLFLFETENGTIFAYLQLTKEDKALSRLMSLENSYNSSFVMIQKRYVVYTEFYENSYPNSRTTIKADIQWTHGSFFKTQHYQENPIKISSQEECNSGSGYHVCYSNKYNNPDQNRIYYGHYLGSINKPDLFIPDHFDQWPCLSYLGTAFNVPSFITDPASLLGGSKVFRLKTFEVFTLS